MNGVLSVVPKRTKGVTFYCSLVVSTIFVAAYGGTHGGARQARIIRHTAWGGWLAGWLADWQMAWALVILDLEAAHGHTHTHTRCLDLAAYLDSHDGGPALWRSLVGREGVGPSKSCEMVLMGWWWCCCLLSGRASAPSRLMGIKLRVSLVVVEVGWMCVRAVLGVVAAERMACVGLHRHTHGLCKLHVVASRPICGVRLWLVACRRDGEGEERVQGRRRRKKASCPGSLGNTRHVEFAVCCFADSFSVPACLGTYIHTSEYFVLGVPGWFVGSK